MSRFNSLLIILKNPWVQSAFNFTLVSAAYIGNHFNQAFCKPVLWAQIVLIITLLPVVFWPVLQKHTPKLLPVWQFLRGIAFSICIYCILFIGRANLALPLFIIVGLGLLGMIPHFFAFQLIYQTFLRRRNTVHRGMFLVGIAFSLGCAYYMALDFRAAIPIARQLAASPAPYEGPHAAAVERILGMHFKYHTRQEFMYDGWRPPFHDPAMVIGYWSVGMADPLDLDLDHRIATYHKVFPGLPLKQTCTCAQAYSQDYRYDPRWAHWQNAE
jgi:hypothetical protein